MAAAPLPFLDKASLVEALRTVSEFADQTEEQLAWFVDSSEQLVVDRGHVLAREGEPAEFMSVVLTGELRFQSGSNSPAFFVAAPAVTGMLPYSRLTRFSGTTTALRPTRLLAFHKDRFEELLIKMPALGPRLVRVMADRIRESSRAYQQHEKLMALGKIAAGLAHELNNPAAAARRAIASLHDCFRDLRHINHELSQLNLTDEEKCGLLELEEKLIRHLPDTPHLDSLERSDLEEELGSWLAAHKIANAGRLAASMAEGGVRTEKLDWLATCFSPAVLGHAIQRLVTTLNTERLIQSIDHTTSQITELVNSVKEYSFMDRAPEQEIDVRQGLDSTLRMLAHPLRVRNVQILKEYAGDTSIVCAHGSELNQVWTNLIDNAIDAMPQQGGVLTIRTAIEPGYLRVEIIDNGTGIPETIQDRVFEPFFTTKDVGQGTGLGLDQVYRVVTRHRGDVRFTSRPGETNFQVRLPLAHTKPEPAVFAGVQEAH